MINYHIRWLINYELMFLNRNPSVPRPQCEDHIWEHLCTEQACRRCTVYWGGIQDLHCGRKYIWCPWRLFCDRWAVIVCVMIYYGEQCSVLLWIKFIWYKVKIDSIFYLYLVTLMVSTTYSVVNILNPPLNPLPITHDHDFSNDCITKQEPISYSSCK